MHAPQNPRVLLVQFLKISHKYFFNQSTKIIEKEQKIVFIISSYLL